MWLWTALLKPCPDTNLSVRLKSPLGFDLRLKTCPDTNLPGDSEALLGDGEALLGDGEALSSHSSIFHAQHHCFFSVSAASSVAGFSGRSNGKRITSRMVCESVSSMQRRSMPMPTPPAGGMP